MKIKQDTCVFRPVDIRLENKEEAEAFFNLMTKIAWCCRADSALSPSELLDHLAIVQRLSIAAGNVVGIKGA